ncbi:hypothetical protein BK119_16280 [Paenibacillus peoriae]|uniref:Uncharacterized protein n=1 Tax=Paenibacillus polymyxa TaxID=1406 RepID=A0ABX2ZIC3_PAEPO|nr:hypothetical protein A7312_19155 [Paenibacillus polymyxa]OME68576.1 hypothetical protein BK119_16280 [Paenibacillus peoriae]
MITHIWGGLEEKTSVFCVKEKMFCITYRNGAWQYFFVVTTAMQSGKTVSLDPHKVRLLS